MDYRWYSTLPLPTTFYFYVICFIYLGEVHVSSILFYFCERVGSRSSRRLQSCLARLCLFFVRVCRLFVSLALPLPLLPFHGYWNKRPRFPSQLNTIQVSTAPPPPRCIVFFFSDVYAMPENNVQIGFILCCGGHAQRQQHRVLLSVVVAALYWPARFITPCHGHAARALPWGCPRPSHGLQYNLRERLLTHRPGP